MNTIISRLKHIYATLKIRGIKYVLARIFRKLYLKFEQGLPKKVFSDIPTSDDIKYQKWLNQNYPRQADLSKLAETVPLFSYQPIISIIMPVFNPPAQFLREAIDSVLNQIYP